MSYGASNMSTLDGQRDYLFMNMMTFIVPVSLVAFVPGIQYSFEIGLEGMAYWDIFILAELIVISLPITFSLKVRKVLFSKGIYLAGIVLVYYVGITGPGMIYILTSLILSIIFYHKKYAYMFASINLIIYIILGVILYLGYTDWPVKLEREDLVKEYIMVVVNYVFLSYVFALLIPSLFDRMNLKIDELEQAMENIELQKKQILTFTFLASHDLQEPLRSIQIFLTKLKKSLIIEPGSQEEISLKFIQKGAGDMRKMINALSDHSFAYRESHTYESFNIHDELVQVENTFRMDYPQRKFHFSFDGNEVVKLPRHQFRLILARLLDNSINFTSEEKEVVIEVQFTSNSLGNFLEVVDLNADFPEDLIVWLKGSQDKFTLFGACFGMMVASEILQNLGGKMNIKNHGKQGSTISIYIPREKKEPYQEY